MASNFQKRLLKTASTYRTFFFEKLQDGVIILDKNHIIVDLNSAARQFLGLTSRSIGEPASKVLEPWPELTGMLEKSAQKLRFELKRITTEPGSWFKVTFLPLQDDEEPPQGQIIILHDITEYKLAINKTRQSEERYRMLIENANEAIMVIQDEQLKYFSPMAMTLLGYTEKEIKATPFIEFFHPDDRSLIGEKLQRLTCGKNRLDRYVIRIVIRNGETKWVEVSSVLIEWEERPAVLVLVSDITERKINEEKLEYLSMHDTLTGLYNRAFFEEEMRRLDGSREYPITIISADVDGLKLINDTMGHTKGDQLLKACAAILRKSLRSSDILARIGGDEFVVILPRTDKKTGNRIIQRIRSNSTSYNLEHNELPLSISLGAATAQSAEVPLHAVYKKADDLMYRDKLNNINSVRSYTIDLLLNALAERDFMSTGHTQRLSRICLTMAEKLDLPAPQLINLAILTQVHDLGKIGVPDSILFKKGILTEEEWSIMRQHPEKGYRLALTSPDLAEFADLILKHHESWDGSGYPLGIKGKEIPIECRIFAIVDAFDAMTSDRPYRNALSKEEAIEELKRCSGSKFDPELVEVFLSIIK